MCWTVAGDEDFRQSLDEMCMSLNELAEQGAAIEVTFYDAEFDEEEGDARGRVARRLRDAVRRPQRRRPSCRCSATCWCEDVVNLMERHFDGAELGGVVAEIDKLFAQRFDALVSSLEIGKPPRGSGGGGRRQPRRRPPAAPPALKRASERPQRPLFLRRGERRRGTLSAGSAEPRRAQARGVRLGDVRLRQLRLHHGGDHRGVRRLLRRRHRGQGAPGPPSPGPRRSASRTRS